MMMMIVRGADADDNRCESRGTEGPCSNLPQQQCQQKGDCCWWDAVDNRCEKNRGGCSGLPQPACSQRQDCFCEWRSLFLAVIARFPASVETL
jgi:hypothetical protein